MLSGTQRVRLGLYGGTRQPYASFAGKGETIPEPEVSTPSSSAGGGRRVYRTVGTYPTPRKKKPKAVELEAPVIKPVEAPPKNWRENDAKIAPFVPLSDAPIVQPITVADAQSLIADAIRAVREELAAKLEQRDQLAADEKVLKHLEAEEKATLTARQIEQLLLLALID